MDLGRCEFVSHWLNALVIFHPSRHTYFLTAAVGMALAIIVAVVGIEKL
jgi:hypothetical protein